MSEPHQSESLEVGDSSGNPHIEVNDASSLHKGFSFSGLRIFTGVPEISIKAEPIFSFGSFHLPNSLFLSFFVMLGFLMIGYLYRKQAESKKKGKFFYLINLVLKGIYKLFQSILKEKAPAFFPFLGAIFLFVLLNNWFGLLPGVGSIMVAVKDGNHHGYFPLLRGNNADLNTTLALAIIAMTIIQISGIKYLGLRTYLKKFINFSNPINGFVGILEIISEFSKVISFSFRLFGNIFAGEVLLAIMAFLIPAFVSFPFLMLEVFVGFIQALVFSMLTSVFLSLAVSHH